MQAAERQRKTVSSVEFRSAASPLFTNRQTEIPSPAKRTWMKYERAQRLVGCNRLLRRLTIGVFARLELLILGGHKNLETLSRIKRCRRDAESLLTGNEAFLLYSLAQAQCGSQRSDGRIQVFFREARLKSFVRRKRDRPLYLFDTFAGLPDPGRNETDFLKKGQFSASLPKVKNLLRGYDNVRFYPGEFPKSAANIPPTRFSFVHLDADLYSSTLAGLEYFYPRMLPGGIIITHDYSTLPGVARAFARICK